MANVPPLDPPKLSPTAAGQSLNASGSNLASYGEWYTATIDGVTLPGKWTVSSGGIRLKVDPKKKAGSDGSNPVFHGIEPMQFELQGEQFSDEERNALQTVLSTIVPQPGSSQNFPPLLFQHAAISLFGFSIFVKVTACSAFQYAAPSVTRVQLSLRHWLPPKANAASATVQPTQGSRGAGGNQRARQAAILQQQANGQVNAAGNQSVLPTSQPGIAGPPKVYTPGSGS